MAAFVVVTLVTLSITQIFSDDAQWEQVSAKGLQQKINVGLEQMYWQWQNEGRPNQIFYRPENTKHAFAIAMRDDGKPQFEVSIANCEKFLNWFVQDVSIDQFVSVSIDGDEDTQKGRETARANKSACSYTMANQRFAYNVQDARLQHL